MKNLGNVDMMLEMYCQNWTPGEASEYISVVWDREGYVLAVGDVVEAHLTLLVDSSVEGFTDFSFQTVIQGTENLA